MKKAGVVLLLALLLCASSAQAADAPYYTLTQDYRGLLVHTQDGYLPAHTFSEAGGERFKRARDLYIDENDELYIADTGNKRVVVCTGEGDTLRVIGDGLLKSPTGLFVRGGILYVADEKREQVLLFDKDTGEMLSTLGHPGTALYGVKAKFRPVKVAVDASGGVYVISTGNTNGVAQFSQDGKFLGYFGANSTDIPFSEKLKRLFYTEQQLAALKKNVPTAATAIDMDANGLVYTVTTGIENGGLRKFNMAGKDIMEGAQVGFSLASDLCVGRMENIFALSSDGYILEYSRDGRALFWFGGKDPDRTRDGLFIDASAIDTDSKGNLYVLDADKNLVQRFAMTEYAVLVHEALSLYQDGLYGESREPWERVLRLNSLFDYAQMGLGHAYYKLGLYGRALNAYRLGGDRVGYSNAYWEVRNAFLQSNILWLFGGLIALSLVRRLIKTLRAKTSLLDAPANALKKFGDLRLARELRYVAYMPRNPADAYYGIKLQGRASFLSATLIYLAVFALYAADKYFCGFLFKSVPDGRFSLGSDVALVFGLIALFLISCNLVCSIREGEATLPQMYKGLAYALTPYLLIKPVAIALSYVLTYNEAFVLSLVNGLTALGCLVMIVLMVREMQCYSFRQSFAALVLTVVVMFLAVVAMVIAAALVAQLWEFISGVIKEASFIRER